MYMTITLTQSEILLCQHIGGLRSLMNRSAGVKNMQVVPVFGGLGNDQDGFIGEYAFCRLFNVFFSLSTDIRKGSYDCILERDGAQYRVDVKTTRRKDGKLLSTLNVNNDVDIYVLAVLNGHSVYFPGYARASDLIRPENLIDLGYGSTYALAQDQLFQWKEKKVVEQSCNFG